ncbi:MAG: hypothetical protein U1F65_05845 [Verrucomicrobiota bacterium]
MTHDLNASVNHFLLSALNAKQPGEVAARAVAIVLRNNLRHLDSLSINGIYNLLDGYLRQPGRVLSLLDLACPSVIDVEVVVVKPCGMGSGCMCPDCAKKPKLGPVGFAEPRGGK